MGTDINMAPALPMLLEILRNSKGNDLYDQARMKAQQGDYSPVEGSWFVDPKETAKVNQGLLELKNQQEATPLLNRIQSIQNDPQFQTMDGQKELRDDPNFWLGTDGKGTQSIAVNPRNPKMVGAIPDLSASANRNIGVATVADNVQRGEQVDGMRLAMLLNQKDGNSDLAKLIDLGKYNDELRSKRGVQDTINASAGVATNPLLAALARATQYGVGAGDYEKLVKVNGLDPVDLKTVEAGDEQGRDVHYLYDPRSGKTRGVVGMPQDPTRKATRVSVNPIIQQESAYSKGKGEYLSKREGDIVSNGDAADANLERLSELKSALKKTPSGPLAPAYTAVGKYTGGMVGANKSEVGYAAKADTISKLNTLGSIKTLGPGITNAERDFLMDAQAKRSHTRAEQAKIIAIYEKDAKYKQRKRDEIVGNTFGDEARQDPNRSERGVVPKLRGTPATASEYMKKWR